MTARKVETDQFTECSRRNAASVSPWVESIAKLAARSARAGVAAPASIPRRISNGKIERSMP